jgi:hypothetical protein
LDPGAHRNAKSLASLEQRLVEAMDRLSMVVLSDGEMQGAARPQSGI